MHLGINIKLIRKRWKIKQEDFAVLFKVNRGSITNYEREINTPDVNFMIQLQDLTGINIRDLYHKKLDLEDIPKKPLEFREGDNLPEPDQEVKSQTSKHPYNLIHLVERVKELEEEMKDLKGNIGDK